MKLLSSQRNSVFLMWNTLLSCVVSVGFCTSTRADCLPIDAQEYIPPSQMQQISQDAKAYIDTLNIDTLCGAKKEGEYDSVESSINIPNSNDYAVISRVGVYHQQCVPMIIEFFRRGAGRSCQYNCPIVVDGMVGRYVFSFGRYVYSTTPTDPTPNYAIADVGLEQWKYFTSFNQTVTDCDQNCKVLKAGFQETISRFPTNPNLTTTILKGGASTVPDPKCEIQTKTQTEQYLSDDTCVPTSDPIVQPPATKFHYDYEVPQGVSFQWDTDGDGTRETFNGGSTINFCPHTETSTIATQILQQLPVSASWTFTPGL